MRKLVALLVVLGVVACAGCGKEAPKKKVGAKPDMPPPAAGAKAPEKAPEAPKAPEAAKAPEKAPEAAKAPEKAPEAPKAPEKAPEAAKAPPAPDKK